ncbi:MAG: hypothetical protein R2749_03310 [Acidimicrobiales bacterium]
MAHEALLRAWPRLRAWLDEDRDGLRVLRHLTAAAAAWEASGRDAGELYRGGRLEAAEAWADEQPDRLNDGGPPSWPPAGIGAMRSIEPNGSMFDACLRWRRWPRWRQWLRWPACSPSCSSGAPQRRRRAETRRLVADAAALVSENAT